jgi:hypothetical protein
MDANKMPGDTKSYDEILNSARNASDGDIEGVKAILIDVVTLDALRRHVVLSALKSATGIGIGSLKRAAYDMTGRVI